MLALVFVIAARASWASPDADLRVANRFYDAGKFAEAVAAYQPIEPKTANVFFNLGNAWFRQEKLGLALLNYERARALAPRDPDILANLRFAEQRLGVTEQNTPGQAVRRFVLTTTESRTMREWAGHEIAALWCVVLAVAGWFWLPRLRTGLLIAGIGALGWWTAATAALASRLYREQAAPVAIVLAVKTEARFAPLPDSTAHFSLLEGTRVGVREDRGQWLMVERTDGQQGWVKADAVERVNVR